MAETLTQYTPEEQKLVDLINGFIDTLADGVEYTTADLYTAIWSYAGPTESDITTTGDEIPQSDVAQSTTEVEDLTVNPELTVVAAPEGSRVPTKVTPHLESVDDRDAAFDKERKQIIRKSRVYSTAKYMAGAAVTSVLAIGSTYVSPNELLHAFDKSRPVELDDTIPASTPAAKTPATTTPGIPAKEKMPSIPRIETAEEHMVETGVVAPATTTPTPEAPVELTLTQRILAKQTTLGDHRGVELGTFTVPGLCDTARIYINNPVLYKADDAETFLSPEALDLKSQLANSNLPDQEKREKQYSIYQFGFSDYSGDPLYAAYPDNTPEGDCVPTIPNTRASQEAYGSLEVDMQGGFADQYQPTGVISEFGSIPGEGSVTLMAMHRSAQSGAGNAMHLLKAGDIGIYSVDGTNSTYEFVERLELDPSLSLPRVKEIILEKYPNQDVIDDQVCQPNDPTYAHNIFVRVDA